MKPDSSMERYRIRRGQFASDKGNDYGAFVMPGPCSSELTIIASQGEDEGGGWQHVSVSCRKRTPNWIEMCFIKGLFWDEEETVIQLHPPKSTWINNHPYCLHLWKPPYEVQLPPSDTVGYKEFNP